MMVLAVAAWVWTALIIAAGFCVLVGYALCRGPLNDEEDESDEIK